MTIPACEPFTAFQTNLPNTFLKLTVIYQGIPIELEGTTYDTGIFPVEFGLFPSGMVNEWDKFILMFTDAFNEPVGVDADGNSIFVVTPINDTPPPVC